jgi:dethiobiotin synthetase
LAKGFFITGTDTGVGKTIISAALIKAVQILGLKSCGMKPIETGCSKQKFKGKSSKVKVQDRDLMPLDGIFLRSMGDAKESIDLVTPVRFQSPLAPLAASEMEGRAVDLGTIKKAYQKLSLKYDAMIVEGIGGLLVPIRKNYFVLDLASDMGLPVVVVARPGLGTINHTLLTVNYALRQDLIVAGIIINYSHPPENSLAEKTNLAVIAGVCDIPVIGVFPHLRNLGSATIQKAAAENVDFDVIRKYLNIMCQHDS